MRQAHRGPRRATSAVAKEASPCCLVLAELERPSEHGGLLVEVLDDGGAYIGGVEVPSWAVRLDGGRVRDLILDEVDDLALTIAIDERRPRHLYTMAIGQLAGLHLPDHPAA